MAGLKAIDEEIRSALAANRVGTPLFTRIVAHTLEDQGDIEPMLGTALEAAARWLDGRAVRLAALGSVSSGQITVQALFSQGQTALVSVGSCGCSRPLLEALVVGNQGTLSWEPAADEFDTMAKPEVPFTEIGRQLLAAANQSLKARQTVDLDGNGIIVPRKSQPRRPADGKSKSTKAAPLTKTSPPFGVLLVSGNQTHQENYARAFAADKRCRLIAVTDEPDLSARRLKLNQALAEELKIPYLADYREALTRNDIHIVSVCAEPERRAKIIIHCAEAGKHLYLDKPMCASAREADDIAAAIRKAGVVSQMFSLVRSPASTRLRQLMSTSALGEFTALHADLMFAKGFSGEAEIEKPRAEVRQPEQFETIDSKREFTNVGVYPLVQLQWLLNKRVTRVCSFTGNYFFAQHQRNNMEDFGVALMELEGGGVASVSAARTGWRSHPSGGLNRNYVIGSKGAATIDLYRPRLEVWADEDAWQPPRRHPEDPMGFWSSTCQSAGAKPKNEWLAPSTTGQNDFEYFLDCVEQGRRSDVPADVGADTIKVLMAAYESAATGEFVATVL